MADTKISALTSIGTIDISNDVLAIVDTSAVATRKVAVKDLVPFQRSGTTVSLATAADAITVDGAITSTGVANTSIPLTVTQTSGGALVALDVNANTSAYAFDLDNPSGSGLSLEAGGASAIGVYAVADTGIGLYGISETGTAGVYAKSSGTAHAAYHYRATAATTKAVTNIWQAHASAATNALAVDNDSTSTSAVGVYVQSTGGIALQAVAGTHYAFYTYRANAASIAPVMGVRQNDGSDTQDVLWVSQANASASAIHTEGGIVELDSMTVITPPVNTQVPLTVNQVSGGSAICVDVNANTAVDALSVSQTGAGFGAYIGTSTSIAVRAISGSSNSVWATSGGNSMYVATSSTGNGYAAQLNQTVSGNGICLDVNAYSTLAALDIVNSGTGPGLQCDSQVIRLAGLKVGTSTKTASDATIDDTEEVVFCNATSGNQTHVLPAVSGNDGLQYTFIKTDSTAYTVTIDGATSETIAGALTQVLSIQYSSLTIVCNGTEWFIR